MSKIPCKIVAGPLSESGFTLTRGTKVLVPVTTPEGEPQRYEELPDVSSITLRATPDDIWRATIEVCVAPPDEICAAIRLLPPPPPSNDITSLSDEARRHRPAGEPGLLIQGHVTDEQLADLRRALRDVS